MLFRKTCLCHPACASLSALSAVRMRRAGTSDSPWRGHLPAPVQRVQGWAGGGRERGDVGEGGGRGLGRSAGAGEGLAGVLSSGRRATEGVQAVERQNHDSFDDRAGADDSESFAHAIINCLSPIYHIDPENVSITRTEPAPARSSNVHRRPVQRKVRDNRAYWREHTTGGIPTPQQGTGVSIFPSRRHRPSGIVSVPACSRGASSAVRPRTTRTPHHPLR